MPHYRFRISIFQAGIQPMALKASGLASLTGQRLEITLTPQYADTISPMLRAMSSNASMESGLQMDWTSQLTNCKTWYHSKPWIQLWTSQMVQVVLRSNLVDPSSAMMSMTPTWLLAIRTSLGLMDLSLGVPFFHLLLPMKALRSWTFLCLASHLPVLLSPHPSETRQTRQFSRVHQDKWLPPVLPSCSTSSPCLVL